MQFRYFRLHFVQIIALLKERVLQKRDSLLTVSFLRKKAIIVFWRQVPVFCNPALVFYVVDIWIMHRLRAAKENRGGSRIWRSQS